jgi:DNA (cytosine-5)-methyltransferase 1
VTRYKGKKLKPLRTHVSPDQYAGLGDVEVIDEEGNYFEVVEVKYNKPIDLGMVIDIYGKLEGVIVNRYYLLTTADPYIIKADQENINMWVRKIREERGCELVINGVIPTIQYYLRLMEDATKYINAYTNTLQEEFQKRAEITEDHVKGWLGIISKFIS